MSRLTVTRQSLPLRALEDAWEEIHTHHPDLPPVALVIAGGHARPGLMLLGQFAAERWSTDTPTRTVHEVLITGEGLILGALEVFGTLLHEAAHALAAARRIADTSRQGRYHNHRFRELAHELGLDVTHTAEQGWATTTVPDQLADSYRAQITALQRAITAHRSSDTPKPRSADISSGMQAARCRCPRRIRVSPSVLAAGPITCANCHSPFALTNLPETRRTPQTRGRSTSP